MSGKSLSIGGNICSDGSEVWVLRVCIFVVWEMVHNVCSFVRIDDFLKNIINE